MSDITILDGGMGQELIRRSSNPAHPLWSAAVMDKEPELVEQIHADYINAGADVITINSYSVTRTRLSNHGEEADFERLQRRAMELAAKARDKSGKATQIAGCLPPLVASYHAELALEERQAFHEFEEMAALQAEGVDLIICETMPSVSEARAAATAALGSGKPVWVALTVSDNEKAELRSGEPLSEALEMLQNLGVDATLINCSIPEAISSAWPTLASTTGPIGAYANGFTSISALEPGGTVDVLEARRDLGPDDYADFADQWIEHGASIIGGCCEVGPAHIAEISRRHG